MKTHSRAPYFLIVLATILFLGQGCVQPPQEEPAPLPPAPPSAQPKTELPVAEPSDTPPPASEDVKELPPPNIQAEQSTYEDFTEAKFLRALEEGRPVYLNFYANWCPTCREQDPRNQQIIGAHPGGILGLRIHTLDNQTGDVEKRYADQYNIFVQHTAIFFKDGKEAFRRIGTQSNTQLQTDLDAISQ